MSTRVEKLTAQVQKLRREMDANAKELAEKNHSLKDAIRQKDAAKQRLKDLRQTFKQRQKNKIKLLQEKIKVEKQLELKEQELQVQNIIHHKEISELRQHLCKIKSKLASERKLAQDLREKLQQATLELKNKCALAHEQEKATKILRTSLKREEEAVDFLRKQITNASTSKDQYTKELEVRRH